MKPKEIKPGQRWRFDNSSNGKPSKNFSISEVYFNSETNDLRRIILYTNLSFLTVGQNHYVCGTLLTSDKYSYLEGQDKSE